MIVYLASYPRSGNSWMQTLLFESFGIVSSSIYKKEQEQEYFKSISPDFRINNIDISTQERIIKNSIAYLNENKGLYENQENYKFIFSKFDKSPLQSIFINNNNNNCYLIDGIKDLLDYKIFRRYIASKDEIYVIKTHEYPFPTYFENEKIIQIIRHPGPTIWSYKNYIMQIENIQITIPELINSAPGFGNWSKYYQSWNKASSQLSNNSYHLIQYEDLKKNSSIQIKNLQPFINKKMTGVGTVSFSQMNKIAPNRIRKGDNKNWEENFTIIQLIELWEKHRIIMNYYNYSEPFYKNAKDYSRSEKYKSFKNYSNKKIFFIKPFIRFLARFKSGIKIITSLYKIRNFYINPLSLEQYAPKKLSLIDYYQKQTYEKLEYYPSISIVTPSYNQAQFIERTILSVLNQEYPNLEYIVQDGNSTDGSQNIIEKYSHNLKHWESISDEGQSNAINLGFKKSSGEIMAYLNSDDILLPKTLEYVANFFNKNPECDVVYGHRVIINENNLDIGHWVLPKHDKNAFLYYDYIPQETVFWRRSIWEKVGGIDENFKFAMDWDLFIRFQQANANIKRLPRFLAGFRIHSLQKTSSIINNIGIDEMKLIRSKYLVNYSDYKVQQMFNKHKRKLLVFAILDKFSLLKK